MLPRSSQLGSARLTRLVRAGLLVGLGWFEVFLWRRPRGLTKLNQYVTGSLIIASDDSEEEGDMDFTEAVKNFKPGFM